MCDRFFGMHFVRSTSLVLRIVSVSAAPIECSGARTNGSVRVGHVLRKVVH